VTNFFLEKQKRVILQNRHTAEPTPSTKAAGVLTAGPKSRRHSWSNQRASKLGSLVLLRDNRVYPRGLIISSWTIVLEIRSNTNKTILVISFKLIEHDAFLGW
jgi:hypothetical protein